MSALIPGILIIASFLVTSAIMFGTFISVSTTQSDSLKDLGKITREQAGSSIDIANANITLSLPSVSTDITVLVDNTGSQSVADFSQMDVIVSYTDSDGNIVRRYLDYNPGGVADNQWSVPSVPFGGITPDVLNPGMWDPDERLTINLKVALDVESGTAIVIAVATPRGANDQISVSN